MSCLPIGPPSSRQLLTSCSTASSSHSRYVIKEAELTWSILADIFDHMDDDPFKSQLCGSCSAGSCVIIMPCLPSPGHPMAATPEEAIIRWVWSITTYDEFCHFNSSVFGKLHILYGSSEHIATRMRRGSKTRKEFYFHLTISLVTLRSPSEERDLLMDH